MSKASLVLLLAVVGCIKVPLNANQERCMVVFTYDASDSIKLHLKFPKAKDQKDNEFWYVSIENTKTMQRETKEIPHGNYRHEIEPQEESTVYNVCFVFSARRNEQFLVDFEANIHFTVKADKIVIPDSLPKTKDVRKTYKEIEKLQDIADKFLAVQAKRSENQDELFIKTANIGQDLIALLRVELGVLAVLMIFQVMALRKWIKQRVM